MQKKWVKAIGLISMATTLAVSNGQVVSAAAGDQAWKVKSNVDTLWEQDQKESTPSFINGELTEQKVTKEKDVRKFFQANQDLFKMDPKTDLKLEDTNKDKLGMTHYIYQPKIQNIPIEDSKIIVHVDKNKKISAVNGDFHPNAPSKLKENRKLTKQQALHAAWKYIHVKRSAADRKQKSLTGETFNTLNETAELVVLDNKNYTLAYRIELQFVQPYPANWKIWVNAENGKIVKAVNQVHEIAENGTGTGTLGDTKQLNTYLYRGNYYLYDTTKSMNGVIETYDNQGQYDYSLPGIYVTDRDNKFTSESQKAAVDAHYYAGVVFDYYYNTFGRVSYDNKGATIRSTVNYGNNYNNAAWIGNQMIYGNGDGREFTYLSGADDIVAHELTHAVIQETADLAYENQPGALNESFADVFGFFVDEDWLLGEDVYTPGIEGDGLRSLSNPPKYHQPDHMDNYRYLPNTRQGDWGGVHINSGIPNKAAYYTINAIGISKAEQIYYRALTTNYLTPKSNFADARQALIQSAQDLYDEQTANAVANAWDRVGVQ